MTLEYRVNLVNQQFAQKGIRVDSDWLNGCVQFFIDENESITTNQLYQQAEEQWELSDLCDSGIKCIPDSILNNKASHIINGTFPLQMQWLLEISESPYDQLQRIQNKEVEVGKEQPEFKQTAVKTKKKRVLKLELTDGFKNVSALEYTPIPCLTTQLTPGTKIIITGPLRCVNHFLFLEAKNVRILGGENPNLIIENAYENVLRKKLKQPINPTPKTDYQEPAIVTESATVRRADTIPSVPMQKKNAIQSNVISSAIDDFPDDDFLSSIDVDQIASKATTSQATTVEKSSSTLSSSSTRPNRYEGSTAMKKSTMLFDDADDDLWMNIDSTIEQMVPQNQSAETVAVNEISANPLLNTSSDAPIYDEKYRFKIRGINLASIQQLKECPRADLERRKYFLVKADIDDITKTAKVSRGKWTLGAALTDNVSRNMTLEVSFLPTVIDKLAGKSGREISEMCAQREEKPQINCEIENTLKNLSDRLETLNAFLKLEFNCNAERAIVVEIIDTAPVLERKLQEKVDYEKLNL